VKKCEGVEKEEHVKHGVVTGKKKRRIHK